MKKVLLLLCCMPLGCLAQTISTIAGGGSAGYGDGGPATAVGTLDPYYLANDPFGNLYVSDLAGNRIRKISPSGIISTVAGPGTTSVLGDGGPATAANLNAPLGITCDTAGNIYICDRYNYRVRKVTVATGIISTVAGNGSTSFGGSGDGGSATAAQFNTVCDVAVDRAGNLYIADNSASVVRKVSTSGIITPFAGVGGSPGFAGDGGPATAGQIKDPRFLAWDPSGNLYIAENLGRHIRMVDTAGTIHTIGGNGAYAFNGDSMPAVRAAFTPQGMVFHNNALYVATLGQRIRKIDFSTDSNRIYTVAGTGVLGFSGDGGPATAAELNMPGGMVLHGCYDIYFGDVDNSRIRQLAFTPTPTVPSITVSGPSSYSPGSLVTVNAVVTNAGSSYEVHWMNRGTLFATTTVPVVTYTKAAGTDTITARVVSTEAGGCYDSTTSAQHVVMVHTGVPPVCYSDAISVFPNPAHDLLNITAASLASIVVTDLLGKEVYENNANATQFTIDLKTWPAGIYILRVNGNRVFKVVKQ